MNFPLTLAPCAGCAARQVTLRLPETRVFEDLAPRLMTTETGDVLVKRLAAIGAGLVIDHVAKGLHD